MLQEFSDALDKSLNENLITTVIESAVALTALAGGIYGAFKAKPDEEGEMVISIDAPRLEALLRKYHMRKLNPARIKKIVDKHGINIAEFKKELRSPIFTKAMNRLINATIKLSKEKSNKNKDAVINAKKVVEDAISNLEPKQRATFRDLMAELRAKEEQW
jgi:hypothetical protein